MYGVNKSYGTPPTVSLSRATTTRRSIWKVHPTQQHNDNHVFPYHVFFDHMYAEHVYSFHVYSLQNVVQRGKK